MSTNEVVLETLTEKIQRQERFIAQLQAYLEQARQASVDTMLGQLRLREAVLLYVGQDADKFPQQIAENFGSEVARAVSHSLFVLDDAPVSSEVQVVINMARARTSKKAEAADQFQGGNEARIALREQAIRDEAGRIRALELDLARERFLRVQSWLQSKRSDITRGGPMLGGIIADDDSLSLAEFEGYGAYGNAVRVTMDGLGDIGELWWYDPEGRPALLQRFVFYTKAGGTLATFSLQYAVEQHTVDAS